MSIFQGNFSVTDGKLDFVCITEGISFEDVRAGLTKLRDEINRQLAEQQKCPFYHSKMLLDEKE